jgi:two-component SAPR family response regulator
MEDPKYNVLIKDYSKYIMLLLTEIIESKSYISKTFENISLAKQDLDKNLPKLIFVDVDLPDSNR